MSEEEKIKQSTDNTPSSTDENKTIEQLQTNEMEVHKHPHHVTHKKKWGEYLLEFFMLFLAVFLGFVAENIREHSVENKREIEYVKLLLSDLRADSAYLIKRNELVESRLQKHKIFYALMTDSSNPSDKQIINAFLPVFYTYDLNVATVAYNQMKASGSLRYIRNENLLNQLQQYYDVMIPGIDKSLDMYRQYYENVLYPFFLKHIRIQDIDDQNDTVTVAKPIIINRTPDTNQEMLNITQSYASDQINVKIRRLPPLAAKNIELINLIKKEYHLENE